MSDKKSLIKLAQESGFGNIIDILSVTSWVNGTVISDRYEILYFRLNNDSKLGRQLESGGREVTDLGTIDIFAMIDPYDYESCALYRVEREKLMEKKQLAESLNSAINIDNREPLYVGLEAVGVIEGLAKTKE